MDAQPAAYPNHVADTKSFTETLMEREDETVQGGLTMTTDELIVTLTVLDSLFDEHGPKGGTGLQAFPDDFLFL